VVIDTYVLLAYATVWTIFYWFLSQYIAELSRQKWTTWVQSPESDDVLLEALEAIIEEIENRMHDKLQEFQKSFFGSIGTSVQKAKKLDPMNNMRKAAKDGDWTSMLVEYVANKAGIGSITGLKEGLNGLKEDKNGLKEVQINAKPTLPKSIIGK
jgi:hypothetical protein